MSAEDGIVHYTVTRIALIGALRYLPLARHMHLEALGGLADSVLAGLPEVSPAGSYMEGVKAERERIAELAESEAARTGEGSFRPRADALQCLADLIREQP